MNTKRILIVSVLVCCLVGLVAYQIGSNAAYPGLQTEKWLSQGSIQPYTYVIEQFNSTYTAAKNVTGYGTTTNLGYEFLSSDAFQVINNAIGNSTGGGTVFVRAGTYTSTTVNPTILLKRHVSLLGEGMNTTIFKCGDSVSKTVMYMEFQDSDDDYDYIEMGNFKIDGNKANNANTTAYGMHIFSLMSCKFHDITIWNTCSTGFYVQGNLTQFCFLNTFDRIAVMYAGESGTGYGMYFTNYTPDNILTGLNIAICAQDGLYFSSSGNREFSNSHIWHNAGRGIYFLETIRDKIMNVEVEKNDMEGVRIHSCYDFTMIGCTINSNGDGTDDTYPEVMMDCDTAVSGVSKYGYENIISSNHIWDRGPDATYSSYALMINETAPGSVGNCSIVGNSFVGYSHATLSYSATGGNNTFTGNIGFKTLAAGNTASCINGTAIAHGLAGTPTSASLTMYGQNFINSTCWYIDPSVYSLNTTHIVICFTIFNAGTITAVAAPNSRTIYWIVSYEP